MMTLMKLVTGRLISKRCLRMMWWCDRDNDDT